MRLQALAALERTKLEDELKEIVETISKIPEPIKRSLFVKECSRLLAVQENLLIAEVNKSRRKFVGEKQKENFSCLN